METTTVIKILTSKFYECTKFYYHQVAGEKLSMIKISSVFISDHLTVKINSACPHIFESSNLILESLNEY